MSSKAESPTIALAPSLGEYFRGPVNEAIRGREVEASPATETYLVHLLSDFANPSPETRSTFSQPVALLLAEAMQCTGTERFRRLQSLGDGVLYGLGFFGQSTPETDRTYFVHVGASAYGHASQMLRAGGSAQSEDVLHHLARDFGRFADVLTWVSDWLLAQSARGQAGLLRMYERWQKTGSPVLQEELGHRGLMPLGRQGGLH